MTLSKIVIGFFQRFIFYVAEPLNQCVSGSIHSALPTVERFELLHKLYRPFSRIGQLL